MPGMERRERIARNEAAYRDLNEQIAGGPGESPRFRRRLLLVCECGDADCTKAMHVGIAEYEGTRAHAARFLVLPGHEIPDAERVVERGESFLVVEKVGSAQDVAESLDARGGEG